MGVARALTDDAFFRLSPPMPADGGSDEEALPTLVRIAGSTLCLPIDAAGHEVERAFRLNPAVPGLMLTEGGAVAGMLSRLRFQDVMAQPYGPSLYYQRSVAPVVDREPLRLMSGTPLDEAARSALERPPHARIEPILVVGEDGATGIVDTFDLLTALAGALSEQKSLVLGLLARMRTTTGKLQETLGELTTTQTELIQSEKMASLGRLVAGVAHEVNTPVGIVLSTASHFAALVADIQTRVAEGSLKKSDFDRFLAQSAEAAGLLKMNAQRADKLITSFKRVSVDQTSGERRTFTLMDNLSETLAALGPEFRHRPVTIQLFCPEGVACDTYPGALSQIVTNFTMNCLIHAFPDGSKGTIRIQCDATEDMVELRFLDDGAGIPPENLPQIFDPFFTTRRGAGGSGLGLHIVYNLVTQTLKGSIAVASHLGEGTCFTVRFPRVHPAPVDDSSARIAS